MSHPSMRGHHLAVNSICPWCRQGKLTKHCDGRVSSRGCDLLRCPMCHWFGTPDQTRSYSPK